MSSPIDEIKEGERNKLERAYNHLLQASYERVDIQGLKQEFRKVASILLGGLKVVSKPKTIQENIIKKIKKQHKILCHRSG